MNDNFEDKKNSIKDSEKQILNNNYSLENQYKHIVDATNIVSKTDLRGVITYANDRFVEISGYSREELIGKPHNIVRSPVMKKSAFKDMWKTIKSKKVWHGIVTNQKKDGSSYTVKASIFPILNEDGDIIEYIAIRHDITELKRLHDEINALRIYDMQQQFIARDKLEKNILNDFDKKESKILYAPSDIMSGDFYSLFRAYDGSKYMYIMDGQGHGASPSLTVFAVSSTINHLVKETTTLQELVDKLFPAIKPFLDEDEQLSYTIVKIHPDAKKISYVSAGMYPFLIKQKHNDITKVKANNLPFMNFSTSPKIAQIEIQEIESVLIYSDGLVEHENSDLKEFSPENLIQKPKLIKKAKKAVKNIKLDDDLSVLYLKV